MRPPAHWGQRPGVPRKNSSLTASAPPKRSSPRTLFPQRTLRLKVFKLRPIAEFQDEHSEKAPVRFSISFRDISKMERPPQRRREPRSEAAWSSKFGALTLIIDENEVMNNENEKGAEHDLRQRIVSLIRANQRASKKPIGDEEVQKLKLAAGRLDHLLQAAVDADGQILKSAAARLDRLLQDIATGKDVTDHLKRRRNREQKENG